MENILTSSYPRIQIKQVQEKIFIWLIVMAYCCITQLSTIFLLYYVTQSYWQRKTTDLQKIYDNFLLYYIIALNQSDNFNSDRLVL